MPDRGNSMLARIEVILIESTTDADYVSAPKADPLRGISISVLTSPRFAVNLTDPVFVAKLTNPVAGQ